jgi:hypothetical protein
MSAAAIIVSNGLWRGFDVLIEPPTASHSLRHFTDHTAALAYAEQLAVLQGWPLFDRTGA